jgi:hypothetical protein
MANTNFDPGTSDIVEYQVGEVGVPGVSSTTPGAVPSVVETSFGLAPTITSFLLGRLGWVSLGRR